MNGYHISENGRFVKYLDILRSGFLNDGIDSGELLTELTRNDLRVQPFNIESFRDRKDLEKYFKSLANHKQNDKEGVFTEYI